jgi:DNA polymerase-3 subunit beta
MKFTILSEKIKRIIPLITRICGTNLTLPILNNILISLENNNLQIFATNLELGLLINLPQKYEKEGKITIPGKIFSDFISSLPKGEIKIEEKDLIFNVKCEDYKAKILGQDSKDFPVLPAFEEKAITKIKNQELISGLSMVSHIVSPFDTRVEISGILMKFEKNKLYLCGTDSIRLAEKTINLKKESRKDSIIIPQRTASELIHVFFGIEGEVEIIIDKSQAIFRLIPQKKDDPQITLISRVIEGSFPEYGEIIPKKIKTEAVFNKEELQNKIKAVSLFSGKIQDIKLTFEPKSNRVSISASSSDIGETQAQLKGGVKGDEIEITFNWRYLLDGLSAISSSEIFLGINEQTSPTIIQPIGDKTYFYILMPKTV